MSADQCAEKGKGKGSDQITQSSESELSCPIKEADLQEEGLQAAIYMSALSFTLVLKHCLEQGLV